MYILVGTLVSRCCILHSPSISHTFQVPPMKAGKKFTRKERPMGGRKDKVAREIALKDTREVSTALSLLVW